MYLSIKCQRHEIIVCWLGLCVFICRRVIFDQVFLVVAAVHFHLTIVLVLVDGGVRDIPGESVSCRGRAHPRSRRELKACRTNLDQIQDSKIHRLGMSLCVIKIFMCQKVHDELCGKLYLLQVQDSRIAHTSI